MIAVAAPIDFYFDFLSPFAYLAHERLAAMAERHGRELRYVPIDLPRAKIAAGNTGPSNREIPAKIRYLMQDLRRWAARYGMPFAFPASLASERLNVATFLAVDRGIARRYVNEAWRLGWGLGGDLGSDALLTQVEQALGWVPGELAAAAADPRLRERYEAANGEAQARGVFGVPTMMIGDEMWWGNDRLEFLEEHLRAAAHRSVSTA